MWCDLAGTAPTESAVRVRDAGERVMEGFLRQVAQLAAAPGDTTSAAWTDGFPFRA